MAHQMFSSGRKVQLNCQLIGYLSESSGWPEQRQERGCWSRRAQSVLIITAATVGDLCTNDIRLRQCFHGVNSPDPSSCSFWIRHSFPTCQVSTEQFSQSLLFLLMKRFFPLMSLSFFLFFYSSYSLNVELFSISCSSVETPVSMQQRWETVLTVEPRQCSSGAPAFIACSGATYQLMWVPGVPLTSALAPITICNGNHINVCLFLVICKHIARVKALRLEPARPWTACELMFPHEGMHCHYTFLASWLGVVCVCCFCKANNVTCAVGQAPFEVSTTKVFAFCSRSNDY